MFRRVRGILNKITPEKFEKLIADILNIIGQGSNVVFKGVIVLIFEKALDEPKYSSMYAQLCKRLAEHAPNLEPPDSKTTTFKRLLLNKCKDEFENRAVLSSAFEKRSGTLTEEEQTAKFLAKRKMLGNIKFIAELGKVEMLHDSILHRCAEQLLVGRKKQSLADQCEDVECLTHLFKTCGRLLDHIKAKTRMDQYFDRIRAIINNPEIPTRIKFLLQDIIEMRRNRWVPRKLATPDGPRTIQQVREDAARDGCIYLPQQDMEPKKQVVQQQTKLDMAIFNKGRAKGMEDIFGGPSDMSLGLGMGPGAIGQDGRYSNGGGGGANGFDGTTFEEKFRETNSNYRNTDQRNRSEAPRRDNFESKFAERPDFGDRFTANRNKTHPRNLGSAPGREEGTGMRRSPGYESRTEPARGFGSGERDMPPRFSAEGGRNFARGDARNDMPLRPAQMQLKPKTPMSLPKSAMAKLDSINGLSITNGKVMMSNNEPAVIKKVDKKAAEKKNQGPTRDEVFGKVDGLLAKLTDNGSTNEAFTSWKEIGIPEKMVNNALIHLFKQVIKLEEGVRALCHQLVDQLFASELVTAVQVRESLARLVDRVEEATVAATAGLAAWSVATDKVKLAEVAEMTEGGATHPFFLTILQVLAAKDSETALAKFRDSEVKLVDQLPVALRTEEQLGGLLESLHLSFLVPLLAIKADMGRQLEAEASPAAFLAWVTKAVPEVSRAEPAFVAALMGAVVRHVSEATTLAKDEAEQEDKDREKEMILAFKEVLQPFLVSAELQLAAVYSLQVFAFSKGFPKGLLLRWFVALYEADIVEEAVFLRWKEDVNDSFPGKGKALFQVNNWLTWLEEAESEDEEEEED